ncbi:MAG: hypothetical protein QG552_251, partial [Thermodesulfobacteriota bacterium]|nr:hypothetical protein [Thermodesulfobacteriota bacterium]
GRMDVERSPTGDIQEGLPQDLPKGHHNEEIRTQSLDDITKLPARCLFRLKDRKSKALSGLFDRRGNEFPPPTLGTVRLRHNRLDNISMFNQFFQRGHGIFRGPHKYNTGTCGELLHLVTFHDSCSISLDGLNYSIPQSVNLPIPEFLNSLIFQSISSCSFSIFVSFFLYRARFRALI